MKNHILSALLLAGVLLGTSCGKSPTDEVLARVSAETDELVQKKLVDYARCFSSLNEGKRFDATQALALAVELGYPEHIPTFINEGADINDRDQFGKTLLSFSVLEMGNLDVAEALIENGADINVLNDGVPLLTDVILKKVKKPGKSGNPKLSRGKFDSDKVKTQFIDLLLGAFPNVNVFSKNGHSPLSAAVLMKDKITAKKILSRGALVNDESHRMLPLILAVKQGNAEIVNLLLDNGANPKLKSSGRSPLAFALEEKNFLLADLLVARGADIDEIETFVGVCRSGNLEGISYLFRKSTNPEIFLNERSGIEIAAENNQREVVTFLVEKGASATQVLPQFVRKGDLEMVQFLLTHKANPNVTFASGEPVIKVAAKSNVLIVQALITAGANPTPALPHYVERGDAEAVRYLLSKKADANVVHNGVPVLEIAAKAENDGLVRDLVGAGANPTPALPYYVKLSDPELVEYLRVNGADFHGLKGIEPVVSKASKVVNGTDLVKMLVRGGANPNFVLPYFVKNSDESLVAFLLENKANPNLREEGVSMVALAGQKNNWKIAKLLVDAGASSTEALPYFVKGKDEAAVSYLLRKGADANAKLEDTPVIEYAAQNENHSMMKLLAEAGADTTPALPHIVEQKSETLVKYLLAKGANPNVFVEGDKPLVAFAAEKSTLPIVKRLIEAGADSTAALIPFVNAENLPAVTYLMEKKANASTRLGRVPVVVVAAQKRNAPLVELLVKNGANATYALPYMLTPACRSSVAFLLKENADPNTLYGVVPWRFSKKTEALPTGKAKQKDDPQGKASKAKPEKSVKSAANKNSETKNSSTSGTRPVRRK